VPTAESKRRVAESTKRIFLNAGWLLGSKGVGGLLSLVYLAIAARTLGADAFGQFALVLTYGQAVGTFVQFQPWQVVVQFGARHLHERAGDRLARLIHFAVALDIGSAVVGALVAVAGVRLIGPLLGWGDEIGWRATLFAVAILAAPQSTPTGVLRLFDRYALAATAGTVTPVVRLVGAVLAALLAPDIDGFLLAWAASEVATALALWFYAARELRLNGVHPLREASLDGVRRENDGIWRFAWFSNLNMTLGHVWLQVGTLAVGWSGGAALAGSYRLAFQFAQALAKPTPLLTRAIYPEFARLTIVDRAALGQVLARTTALTLGLAVLLVLLAAVAGRPFLTLVAGPAYLSAYLPLVVLTSAAALNLVGVSFEPAILAFNRPATALVLRAIAAGAYLAALWPMLDRFGAIGAAYAALGASALSLVMMGAAAGLLLPRAARGASRP